MRPRVVLVNKVATALNRKPQELMAALAGWPEAGSTDCWSGRQKVFHDGRPRQTLRLCYELATGHALPEGMRLREKLCLTSGCLNLHHYRVKPHVSWQEKVGLVSRDLVETAAVMVPPPELLAEDSATVMADIRDLITSADGGRHRTAAELRDHWFGVYDLEPIQMVLDQLRAEDDALWAERG